ncbi:MAG: TldD/PmbA family protein [Chloroflexi bacterium]|nr:TldD/PmbA family protein [Chloroflexota bacterium]
MLDDRQLRQAFDRAFAYSRADQTEISLFVTDASLTRFANNYVHQNVSQADTSVVVRLVFGKKIAVASINSVEESAVRAAIDRATDMARFQVENSDFRSLPSPLPYRHGYSVVPATADCVPARRADAAGVICRLANERGYTAAGTFSTEVSQVAVANSLGVFAHHADTLAECTTVITSDTGSGYADRRGLDVDLIDSEAIGREALDKAIRSRNPISVEPGEYEVILEDYAVSDLLDFLGYVGFGGLAVQEGQSFMTGRFDQILVGENVTIWDDTGGKDGHESTGHALPAGDTFGPVPQHLFLEPGAASLDDMVKDVKRGIWVSRFWYTRLVHPLTVTVTGMTRDGAFLIENGEITRPVKNMRFTQSYLEALRNVDLIGARTSLQRTMFPFNVVPALKIGRWNFTGSTEF